MSLKLGVLISGGGTTMVNLQKEIEAGRLDARIVRVISSRSKVAGVERARDMGLSVTFMGRKKYVDDHAYSAAIDADLAAHDVDLVVLAGFLRKYHPGSAYAQRTINIHPSLLPAFGGHGYYGMKVHEAVHARGCRVSGCTIHLVTDDYDAGPIILQKAVSLSTSDSAEDIRRKVFEVECLAYPKAIQYFIDGRIRFENGRARIDA